MIDGFGEQVDGVSLAVGAYLTQRHHRPEGNAAEREEAAQSLQQGGADIVFCREPFSRSQT